MNKVVKLLLASTAALSLAASHQAESVSAEVTDAGEVTAADEAAATPPVQVAEDVAVSLEDRPAVSAEVAEEVGVPAAQAGAEKKVANTDQGADIQTMSEEEEEGFRVATGRVSGENRYSNSAALSKYAYTTTPTVYIANGYTPTDSLAGAPLAANEKATILLTRQNELDGAVKTEIQRLKAQRVVILGGENSLSARVAQQLKDMNLKVERIAGADRYEQAANVAKKIVESNKGQYPAEAFLASGDAYADALSISGIAAKRNVPIFLTRKDKLNDNVLPFLEHIKKWTVLGGENSISKAVVDQLKSAGASSVERIGGNDRYHVNRNILEKYGFMSDKKQVLVANGDAYSDALPASIPAFVHSRDIILVSNSDRFLLDQVKFLRQKEVKSAVLVGGLNTISNLTHNRISAPDDYIRYTDRMNGLSDLMKEANRTHKMTLRQYFPAVTGRNLEYYGIGNDGRGVGDFIFRTTKLLNGQEVSIGTRDEDDYHLYAIYAGMYDEHPEQEIILIFTTLDGKPVLFSSKEKFGRDDEKGRTLKLSDSDFQKQREAYQKLWQDTL